MNVKKLEAKRARINDLGSDMIKILIG